MDNSIIFDQVTYTYNQNSPFQHQALEDVSFKIPSGKVTAIIGHTGSGKSTILQHLNVLSRPTRGRVVIAGEEVTATSQNKHLKALRKKVGLVFQFPEAQLFEETVIKDVMFGPLNFGASLEEAEAIAKKQLEKVGIGEDLYQRSPFDLSGGQMRRVAIAGVLALEPEILVLDEPTAGLDPKGHQDMLNLFMEMQAREALTLVMVTHHMEDVLKYAEHVLVMESGRLIYEGSVEEVFSNTDWLVQHRLGLPKVLDFLKKVEQISGYKASAFPKSIEDLAQVLLDMKGGQ